MTSTNKLMPSTALLLRSLKDRPALTAFLFTALFFLALCLPGSPRWETNDDVHMSMVAHGYGLAAYGSPHLIYSNVLWGYLVRSLPSIHGVLGYSLATMTVLFVSGWTLLYFLLRLGTGFLISGLALIVVMARPALFPQFTINAGLLTIAAVAGLRVFARFGDFKSLLVSCLLAFIAYLIRSRECLLIFAIAFPLLPWQALLQRKPMQIAIAVLALAMACATFFNSWSYRGPEWQAFKELNAARTPITDWGAGGALKEHPEILARYGYSKNDIELISERFYVDPNIANPKTLNAMIAELGPGFMQDSSLQSGLHALEVLQIPAFLPAFLAGIILFVGLPQWRVGLAWVLALAAFFAMGAQGHRSSYRVYFPVLSLLFLAPFFLRPVKSVFWRWMTVAMLAAACGGTISRLIPLCAVSHQVVKYVKQDLQKLRDRTLFTWGPSFPFEVAFPVLSTDPIPLNLRLYAVNVFMHAPFTVSAAEQRAGRGMVERLRTPQGISIVASEKLQYFLSVYCIERFKGLPEGGDAALQTKTIQIKHMRCAPPQ